MPDSISAVSGRERAEGIRYRASHPAARHRADWRQEILVLRLRATDWLLGAGPSRPIGLIASALLLIVVLWSFGSAVRLQSDRPTQAQRAGPLLTPPTAVVAEPPRGAAPMSVTGWEPRAGADSQPPQPQSGGQGQALLPTQGSQVMPSKSGGGATPTAVALRPANILNGRVPAGKQERNLSCEFQSAADLAWFYGIPLTWQDVFLAIGHDPNGDPQRGFVGKSFDDPPGGVFPNGYGVYADPIARTLREHGLLARAYYNSGKEWLMDQIAAGHPVIVWTTYGMQPSEVTTWHTADGQRQIKAVRREHTYTAIGYDSEGIWVNDPLDGQRYHYAWASFLQSWGYLDQMAVVAEGAAGQGGR